MSIYIINKRAEFFSGFYWKEFGRWQVMVLVINIMTLSVASYFFSNRTITHGITFTMACVLIGLALKYPPQYRYSTKAPIIAFTVSSPPALAVMITFFWSILSWLLSSKIHPDIGFLIILIMLFSFIGLAINCLVAVSSSTSKGCYYQKTKIGVVWLSALSQFIVMLFFLLLF